MLEINVSIPTLLPDGLPPSTVAVQCTKVCTQVYTTYNKLEASMTVVDNTVQTVCGSTERLCAVSIVTICKCSIVSEI